MLALQSFSYEAMQCDGGIRDWFGHILYFLVTNPVDLEIILKTYLEKDDLSRFIKNITVNGIIFAPGDDGEKFFYLPLTQHIEQFFEMFSKNSENFVKKLANVTGKGKFSIWPYLSAYALDSIIKRRRNESNKEKNNLTPSGYTYSTTKAEYNRKTFLDLLISLSGGEKGYTNLELREEILTLTIAATDTSAVPTGNTLNLLAKYPKIQDKAYEELYEIFGNSKRSINREDLLKMKLLERIIKESLRLFPPAPFISRKVETDITLPSGRVLPAGSGVLVSVWGCHRDLKYWGSNAEHFDPDRFLPERFNLKHACSFLPFSNGPRNCVGYQYALMSMKTSLATILRNYKVVGEPEKGPIPHIRFKLSVMMKDIDGYQVTLERRPGITL